MQQLLLAQGIRLMQIRNGIVVVLAKLRCRPVPPLPAPPQIAFNFAAAYSNIINTYFLMQVGDAPGRMVIGLFYLITYFIDRYHLLYMTSRQNTQESQTLLFRFCGRYLFFMVSLFFVAQIILTIAFRPSEALTLGISGAIVLSILIVYGVYSYLLYRSQRIRLTKGDNELGIVLKDWADIEFESLRTAYKPPAEFDQFD